MVEKENDVNSEQSYILYINIQKIIQGLKKQEIINPLIDPINPKTGQKRNQISSNDHKDFITNLTDNVIFSALETEAKTAQNQARKRGNSIFSSKKETTILASRKADIQSAMSKLSWYRKSGELTDDKRNNIVSGLAEEKYINKHRNYFSQFFTPSDLTETRKRINSIQKLSRLL